MVNSTTSHNLHSDPDHNKPGVDLKWPASAIWRYGEPKILIIGAAEVMDALRRGIDDFRAVPTHAIFLLLIYPVVGFILFRLAFGYDVLPLIYPMAAGFALLGPVVAIGLYELSRRRELGFKDSAIHAFEVLRSPSIGAIARLGAVLAAIFLAWLFTANLIYAQIFGGAFPSSVGAFLDQVTSTPDGHQLIIVGHLVGLIFAAVVLVISIVSFPMLVDRADVSASTAVRTSIRAALENPLAVALWGFIVAVALVVGALPFLLGLAVVLPVLGHATWHLYRKLVEH